MKPELCPIRYTHHAKERMIERRISQEEVEQVIRTGARQPDGVNKWIAFGTINARRLELVYVETEEEVLQVLLVLSLYERRY